VIPEIRQIVDAADVVAQDVTPANGERGKRFSTMRVVERDEVKRFLSQVWNEDTLTVLVRTHLHAEAKLIRLLQQCRPNPKALKIDRMTFARKLELGSAQKLITQPVTVQVAMLNKLRNRFAHNLDAEIVKADVDALLQSFVPAFREKIEMATTQAAEFKKITDEVGLLNLKLRVCLIAVDAGLLGNLDANLDRQARSKSEVH
jgi:hypothetical protein